MNSNSPTVTAMGISAQRSTWLFSWPLIVGMLVYSFVMFRSDILLRDGDTYLHIATGRWILQHRVIPSFDPFSHTMPGMAWTAHEWLSEVILAIAHDLGGWTGVAAITALAIGVTLALLAWDLQRSLEPVHALLCTGLAFAMTLGHLLARPHILAMPCLMLWTVSLVKASESGRSPSLWVLPVMTLWANLHGGFTLGLVLTFAFVLEVWLNKKTSKLTVGEGKSWLLFIVLAIISSLITPHGLYGVYYTWQILFEGSSSLEQIGEWQSPNFHQLQPLELWLLGLLGLILYQGLLLPPVRLALLLGLIHLSLKHVRHIELLGLLAPILLAKPFAPQLQSKTQNRKNAERLDRFFLKLAQPAGQAAVVAALSFTILLTVWIAHSRSPQPSEGITPSRAIEMVKKEGIKGPVLNDYSLGGYLIYAGIPPFIDGRADVYGVGFLKAFIDALTLNKPDGLDILLEKYKIEWTLLTPGSPAVPFLDHLSGWRRLYSDKGVVVHVRTDMNQSIGPVER